VRFQLWFSHFGAADLSGARLTWSWDGAVEGTQSVPACPRGGVAPLAAVSVPAGACVAPIERVLSVSMVSPGGAELARNSQAIVVYPSSGSLEWPGVEVYDPRGALGKATSVASPRSGEKPARTGESARHAITVTDVLDGTVLSALSGGATVLCLVDSNTIAPAGFPMTVIARDSANYDGNWASVLNWVHPTSQVIGWLPTAPRMAFAASGIGLPFVLGGITPDWMPDVHAGMFIGWLHSNAAYIVQMKVGSGKLLLCTIPVAGAAGVDPFATRLFHELLRYAASDSMQPRQSWNP